MSPVKARSRARRWLLGAAKLLAVCAAALALAVWVVLGTSFGRARLLAVALPRVDDALPGSLRIEALERLTPWGVTLSTLVLADPAGTEVVRLGRAQAELDAGALLGGRIVLRELTLGPGHVDLRELDVPGRGLLAALVDPDAPAATASEEPGPYLRIDRARVHGLSVRAPEGSPLGALEVRDLELSAQIELDHGPRARLDALDARVLRGGQLWATVGPVTGVLERGGAPSSFSARLGVGGASMRAAARGVLPSAPGFEDSPLTGELHVDELRAETLALVLGDPSLAGLFTGAIGLELTASGSVDTLAVESVWRSDAGQMQLDVGLRDRARLTLTASASGLGPRRLRPELPPGPLSFSLTSSADLTDRDRIPLELRLRSAQLGRYTLPELDATATWREGALRGLLALFRRGPSSLRVTGDLARDHWDLTTHADVREPELVALADALGSSGHAPGGRVVADLRVRRAVSGVMSVAGNLDARDLKLAGLALARADVSLDVAGELPELGGKVHARLQGVTAGEARLRRADVRIEGGPEQYRVWAKADLPQLHGAVDLRLERRKSGVSIQGSARGELEETPFALTLGPTTISSAGSVDTQSVELQIAGQTLRASGLLSPTRSALVVTASQLDVEALSRLLDVAPAISGRAELSARLSGSLTRPVVSARLAATQLRRSTSEPMDVALDAELDAAAGRLELEGSVRSSDAARADVLGASLRLSSSFGAGAGWLERVEGATSSLRLELQRLDLAQLQPWVSRPLPNGGELGLELRVEQENGRLEAALEVTDARGPWLDLGAKLTLPPRAAGGARDVAARLRELPANSRWEAHAAVARRALDEHWPEQALAGHLDVEGNLSMSHEPGEEPVARAFVRVAPNAARAAPAGCNAEGVELALDAELADGRLRATVLGLHARVELLRGSSAVDVQLAPLLRGRTPLFGAVSSQWVSHRLELQKLPFLCRRLSGSLDAKLDLVDPLGEQPRLDAVFKATQLSLGSDPALDVELRAHADRGAARVEADVTAPLGRSTLRAALPISWFRGRVTVSPEARLSAHARLENLPIAPLLDPAGAVSHARGRVTGELHVEGPLQELTPSGRVELEDAELTATSLAQPLHGVRGRFAFKDKRLEITGLEARDKEGLLELSGHVMIHDPSSVETRLKVKARKFPLRQRGQVVATTSGEASILAQLSSARTDISVQLKNVDTWLEKGPARGGIALEAHPDVVVAGVPKDPALPEPTRETAASPGHVPEMSAGARPSRLSLDATDHFWVKREDFAIQLSMRLVAQLGAGPTSVKGRVDLHRGYLDLMGKVFDIRRGSHLELTGGEVTDPVIAIEASHERRSSGKTIHVKISGRASRPELRFFIDEAEVSAGQALEELVGRQGSSGEESARNDAASFVSGLTAGLLATSARRELGAAAPIIMIEPGAQTGEGRLRAGFELDSLIPDALASLITGVYLEGIVTKEEAAGQQSSTQAGVLVELYFPNQLFTTGQWGPGATWSIDWGWQL